MDKELPRVMLAYDTETTGLTLHPDADVEKQPKMIEFGGVMLSLDDGSIIEEISLLVDPREPLTEEITKITGLRDEDLKGAPTFLQVLPTLRRLFSNAQVLVAHNLPFDKSIIRGELARNGIQHFAWPPRDLCTVGLYKDIWGRNPRLIELYADVMGRPLAQTHRALDDVKALVEIIQKEEIWRFA